MNQLVIINGSGGSGKDTFVKNCKEFLKRYNIEVLNYSTIELIKDMMRQYLGWNNTKTEKDRKCMSDMKRICKEYNNAPFDYVANQIHNTSYPHFQKKLFFVHTREPEEIQEFIDYFEQDKNIMNIITLLVKRLNHKISSNDSDRRVDEFNYDYIISNNETLEELDKESKTFSKMIILNFLNMEEKDHEKENE